MVEMFNNKNAFLKLKPYNLIFIIILVVILFSALISFIIKNDTYDNYQTKGYVTCDKECAIMVLLPSNIDFDMIYLNNKKINYKIISKELKIDQENFISYNEIKFTTDENFQDQEILEFNFYYNKQRIMKKIIDIIF